MTNQPGWLAYGLAGGMGFALLLFIALIVVGKLMSSARTETMAWGFVDESGTERIRRAYDQAHSFHHGLAAVEIDGKTQKLARQKLRMAERSTYNRHTAKLLRDPGFPYEAHYALHS